MLKYTKGYTRVRVSRPTNYATKDDGSSMLQGEYGICLSPEYCPNTSDLLHSSIHSIPDDPAGLVSAGGKLLESASNLVPQSVPRPVAKGGVAVVGVFLIFGLLQKVRCFRRPCMVTYCTCAVAVNQLPCNPALILRVGTSLP